MTNSITNIILTLVLFEMGVVVIWLFRKLTGHEERFMALNVEYITAYAKGLFPITIGAVLVAFVIWLIG